MVRPFISKLKRFLSFVMQVEQIPGVLMFLKLSWNPIEHRVFPHVNRAMEGVMLHSHEQVQSLIEKTTTKTGLKITANIIKKTYKIGKVVAKEALKYINIKYGDIVSGLNYSISPEIT